MARKLRTIDVKAGSIERARDIAAHVARYVRCEERAVDVELDRAHARGCDAQTARARLYVIDRAARLAEQYDNGERYTLIVDAVSEYDREKHNECADALSAR